MSATDTTTQQPQVTAGVSVNPEAAKTVGPKLKPETEAQAARLKAAMELNTTTNTIVYTSNDAIDKELAEFGQTRESLTKLANNLHNLTASHTLASGEKAHDHWASQKTEERAPVVAPISLWEGQSVTATHHPVSIERLPGRGDQTVSVPGQVNLQSITNIGRSTGQMSAVRQHLRQNATEKLK